MQQQQSNKADVVAVTNRLRRLFDRWMRAVEVNMTHSALARLDDRTLADIGLERSNLRWSAAQVVDAARAQRAKDQGIAQRPTLAAGDARTAPANDTGARRYAA